MFILIDFSMNLTEEKLPSIEEAFDSGFQVAKKGFANYFRIHLRALVIPLMLFVVWLIPVFILYEEFINSPTNQEVVVMAIWNVVMLAPAVALFFWNEFKILYATPMLVKSVYEDQEVDIEKLMKIKKDVVWGVIGLALLLFLIAIGGTMLLVVPALIFSVWFVFAFFIFSLEKKNTATSLERSKDMTQGYRWKIFWFMIASQIVISILITAALFIFSVVVSLLLSIAPLAIVGTVASLAALIAIIAYTTLFYAGGLYRFYLGLK